MSLYRKAKERLETCCSFIVDPPRQDFRECGSKRFDNKNIMIEPAPSSTKWSRNPDVAWMAGAQDEKWVWDHLWDHFLFHCDVQCTMSTFFAGAPDEKRACAKSCKIRCSRHTAQDSKTKNGLTDGLTPIFHPVLLAESGQANTSGHEQTHKQTKRQGSSVLVFCQCPSCTGAIAEIVSQLQWKWLDILSQITALLTPEICNSARIWWCFWNLPQGWITLWRLKGNFGFGGCLQWLFVPGNRANVGTGIAPCNPPLSSQIAISKNSHAVVFCGQGKPRARETKTTSLAKDWLHAT